MHELIQQLCAALPQPKNAPAKSRVELSSDACLEALPRSQLVIWTRTSDALGVPKACSPVDLALRHGPSAGRELRDRGSSSDVRIVFQRDGMPQPIARK